MVVDVVDVVDVVEDVEVVDDVDDGVDGRVVVVEERAVVLDVNGPVVGVPEVVARVEDELVVCVTGAVVAEAIVVEVVVVDVGVEVETVMTGAVVTSAGPVFEFPSTTEF